MQRSFATLRMTAVARPAPKGIRSLELTTEDTEGDGVNAQRSFAVLG